MSDAVSYSVRDASRQITNENRRQRPGQRARPGIVDGIKKAESDPAQ
jgi:hypothetical protein